MRFIRKYPGAALALALLIAGVVFAQFSPPSGGGGGAVSSVFGRTGAVTATSGDYSSGQISGLGAAATHGASITVGGATCTLDSSCTPAGGSSITQGTYASLPATCATGDLYYQTDGPYTFRCSATNIWSAFLGGWGQVTVPPTGSWTSDNVSTGSFDSTNGIRYGASLPTLSGNHGLRLQYQTAPTAPYAVSMGLLREASGLPPGTNSGVSGYGVVFGDGSGKYISLLYFFNTSSGENLFNATWSAATSTSPTNLTVYSNSSTYQIAEVSKAPLIWFCLADDGTTNLTFYWSIDRRHWKLFDTRGRTAFLASGPTRIGFAADPFSNTVELALVDYTVNASAATCQ